MQPIPLEITVEIPTPVGPKTGIPNQPKINKALPKIFKIFTPTLIIKVSVGLP